MEWDNESIVRQIQEGQGNRNELLEKLWTDNIKLVRKIIHEITGLEHGKWSDRQEFEDLEQQAFLGILDSIPRYDSEKGIKFLSFAYHYIRKSILRFYDRSGQAMRLPGYMRSHIRAYLREKERQRTEKEPATDESIRKALGMSGRTFQTVIKAIQKLEMQRLDSYLNENDKESGTILDMIASNESTSETAIISTHDRELRDLMRIVIQTLPETERMVIMARYYQGHSLRYIAQGMNCSTQYVSQLSTSAYKRIRTGKYAKELISFLPERAIHRAQKRIQDDFKDLSEQERGLLI